MKRVYYLRSDEGLVNFTGFLIEQIGIKEMLFKLKFAFISTDIGLFIANICDFILVHQLL
jgi:hypothetical protein